MLEVERQAIAMKWQMYSINSHEVRYVAAMQSRCQHGVERLDQPQNDTPWLRSWTAPMTVVHVAYRVGSAERNGMNGVNEDWANQPVGLLLIMSSTGMSIHVALQ